VSGAAPGRLNVRRVAVPRRWRIPMCAPTTRSFLAFSNCSRRAQHAPIDSGVLKLLSGGRSTLRPYDPIDSGVLKLLSGGRSTLRPYDPIDSGVLKLLSGGRSTLRPYDPIDFGVLKLLSGGRSTLRPYDPIDSGVLKLLSGGRSTLRPLEFVHISSIFIAEVEHGARRFAGPHKNCRAQESHTK